jgi:hypothetical protein
MPLHLSFPNFEVLIKWESVLVIDSPIIYNEYLEEYRHHYLPPEFYFQSPDYRKDPIYSG